MADQISRAAIYNLAIEQGATYRLPFVVGYRETVNDSETIITPYDLTGCTARAQLREAYGEPVLLFAKTESTTTTDPTTGVVTVTAPGLHITDPLKGRVELFWSDEQTDTLAGITRAVWDLEIEYPSGDVQRVMQGKVTISPNITRD